jgi:hypothetical protein
LFGLLFDSKDGSHVPPKHKNSLQITGITTYSEPHGVTIQMTVLFSFMRAIKK